MNKMYILIRKKSEYSGLSNWALYQYSLGTNAQSNWRVSFSPIRKKSWKSIEGWDDTGWKPYENNLTNKGESNGS